MQSSQQLLVALSRANIEIYHVFDCGTLKMNNTTLKSLKPEKPSYGEGSAHEREPGEVNVNEGIMRTSIIGDHPEASLLCCVYM